MSVERYPYKDAVLEVEAAAIAAGIQPSAVEELVARVTRENAEGMWKNVRGEIVRTAPGGKPEDAEEFIASLEKSHPHYWISADAADAAELAFGEQPTLKARGEFIRAFGETNYRNTMKQWGCDDSLRPGTKPGPTHDEKGRKLPPPEGSSSNPWNAKLFNGTQDERFAKMASIIRQGVGPTSLAAKLSKSAGCTITGAPLKR